MTAPSPKTSLRELRGRSIMQNSTKSEISADVLTDRTIRTPILARTTLIALKWLHPYIREAPYANVPFNELVYHFRCDVYPEGEVFWWQLHTLTVLHALKLWTFPGLLLQRPSPPGISTLSEETTLEKYLGFPEELRKEIQYSSFRLLMVPEQFTIDHPRDLCVIECSKDVFDAMQEESKEIERGRALRYAKFYGASCYACKSMGKGKMVCSRCNEVFYCGKECQKKHWPEHKKECLKGKSGGGSKESGKKR